MQRAVRPMTLDYKGAQITFDMPGWYCDSSDESIHTGEDMKVSDRAFNRLKAATEGLPLPEEIKRIRTKLGLTQKRRENSSAAARERFKNTKRATSCRAAQSVVLSPCSITIQRGFPSFMHALILPRPNTPSAAFTRGIRIN